MHGRILSIEGLTEQGVSFCTRPEYSYHGAQYRGSMFQAQVHGCQHGLFEVPS